MENELNFCINEYKKQLDIGYISKAYKGIIEYISKLKSHLIRTHSDHFASGNLYQGYMDITYFSFTPQSLRNKSLKIAIVFNHEKIRFEVWLVGQNKRVQEKYWKLFKKNPTTNYTIPATPEDCVVEKTLVENPEFNKPQLLTEKIENGVMEFIKDVLGNL